MNNNIDLTEILKDCKEGTKLYCTLLGEVEFVCIKDDCKVTQIVVCDKYTDEYKFTKEGKYYNVEDGECLLFPSKDQRDWSKFIAPWYKKEKFDPKTLQPFDKILVKRYDNIWVATLLSHSETHTYGLGISYLEFTTINNGIYKNCIPYNEETKYLVGTTQEPPLYYRYWKR